MRVRSKLFSLLLCLGAAAQAAPPVAVTRTDWAAAVDRFYREYATHPPSAEHHDAVQKLVDQAYGQFFSGSGVEGIRGLADAAALLGPTTRSAGDALIDSLQIRVVPVISRQDRAGLLRIRVQPFYPQLTAEPVEVTLVIRGVHENDKAIFSTPVHLDFSAGPQSLTLPKPAAEPGSYVVELVDPAGKAHRVGQWFVTGKSLDSQRVATARLLSTTRPTTQSAWDAQVLVRARNALLTDNVDLNNPTILTRDPFALADSVAAEASAVMKGEDPFDSCIGDAWRGIPAGGSVIPARIYVPRSALYHPSPLLICLPEATADENDLMDHLAGTPLQEFATQNGWIVLCARTVSMLSSRDALANTLRTLGNDQALDRSRICLLGHGVGAIAAIDLAVTSPGVVSKIVLIGGGEFGGVTQLPKALQIVGSLDQQFPPRRADESLHYAQDHALPVEQTVRDSGHTLLLVDALDEALHWISK